MAMISHKINSMVLTTLRFLGVASLFGFGTLGGVVFMVSPVVGFVQL